MFLDPPPLCNFGSLNMFFCIKIVVYLQKKNNLKMLAHYLISHLIGADYPELVV